MQFAFIVEYFKLDQVLADPVRFFYIWAFWYVLTAASYLILAFGFYRKFTKDKLGKETFIKGFRHIFTNESIKEDMWQSLHSFVYVTLCIAIAMPLLFAGYGRMYFKLDEHSYSYLILSPIILVVLHDLYHYWMHRLSHKWTMFYRLFHSRHHQVKHPTAFSGWAMHPIDAVVNSAFVFLIPFILPLHPIAVFINMNIAFYLSFTGHSLDSSSVIRPFSGVFADPEMHVVHHKRQDVNYGFLTRIWDRVFRTEL